MSDGTFFTFPLCLLAYPADEKERLQIVIAQSLERAGLSSDIEPARVSAYVSEHPKCGFKFGDETHAAFIRGAMVCRVEIGWLPGSIERAAIARKFVSAYEARHGKDPLVFISSALLWGCHNNDDPVWRDFTVLCAVNSLVGFKKVPVLVRRSMLLARQLGYKSPAVMTAAEIPQQRKALTVQQLRDSLDRLEIKSLLTRCQWGHSNIYFSTTLGADDLRKAVVEGSSERQKLALRRQLDREALLRTKAEPRKNQCKTTPPKRTKAEPMKKKEPDENQEGTETGTKTGTKGGTNVINAFQEMPLNKRSNDAHDTHTERASLNCSEEELRQLTPEQRAKLDELKAFRESL